MRYLKSYEQSTIPQEKTYWLIPTDKRGIEALREVNCNDKSFLSLKHKYIYLCYNLVGDPNIWVITGDVFNSN